MENQSDVKKIIEYIQGKINHIQEKLKSYDSPIMQELIKGSQHIQLEYIRLNAELQANQDNLLAIQKFCDPGQPVIKPDKPKGKNKNGPGNSEKPNAKG